MFDEHRWVNSQAKKDGVDENIAKYDGKCNNLLDITSVSLLQIYPYVY